MTGDIEEQHVAEFLSNDPNALSDASLDAISGFAMRVIRYRYGRDKVRDADLEDLAHEATEAAWKSRNSFRGSAAFTTWFSRIIVRTAHKHWTRNRVEMEQGCSIEGGGGEDEDGWKPLVLPARDDTAGAARIRILWSYAETILSERQLRAFQMSYEGYSEQEIGDALGVTLNPASTAKQLIKAARAKLRLVFDMTISGETGGNLQGSSPASSHQIGKVKQ